jgi:hypothetical protein
MIDKNIFIKVTSLGFFQSSSLKKEELKSNQEMNFLKASS